MIVRSRSANPPELHVMGVAALHPSCGLLHSKIHVQAELALHQDFVFLIAGSAILDHFFIGLARSPREERHRVRPDRIAELPTVPSTISRIRERQSCRSPQSPY